MFESKKALLFINMYKNIWQSLIYLKLKVSKILGELNMEQFIVLSVMYSKDDICQSELAKIMSKPLSNVSRIISSLENKGLVNRLIGTKDNRLIKKLLITEKGKKIIEKEQNNLNEALSQALKKIPENEIDILQTKTKYIERFLSKLLNP